MKIKRFFSLALVCCAMAVSAQNVKYVNMFMGSAGDNGQLAPGATVPFGVVCVCPDSDPRQHAGYNFETTKVTGISINRLSGVGCSGGGGNIRIRPLHPSQPLHIDKQTEKAVPGYYATAFTNGIQTELTATNLMAVERYVYPENLPSALWIDFSSCFEGKASYEYRQVSDNSLEGFIHAKTTCGRGMYKLYFSLNTDQAFQLKEHEGEQPCLDFGDGVKKVEVRIGLSALGTDEARKEYARWEKQSFNRLKKASYKEWEELLSAIDIQGGTEDDRAIFYTSLFRACLSPVDVTSVDGRYLGTDGKTYNADGFRYYSNWSLWDTYRTKFPLLVLLEPAKMRDMATSLLHLYRTGKQDWSTPNESTTTVRTEHAVILLLDAYRKGITNLDFNIGYAGMQAEMERLLMRSPDQKMEAACDLWAMAQISEIMGKKDDAALYEERSKKLFEETWKKEFMNVDASYEKMKGNGLYQGTRWQYRWAAPQFLGQMIDWVSKETLLEQLTYFFDNHLYNQGNEPDIHVPYIFNRLGAPEKTQKLVTCLMTEPMIHKYGGNAEFPTPYFGKAFMNAPMGYSPEMDEDDGTMSAWYVFGALGFYPMVVGDENYELTSPLFDKITLRLENGSKLTIQTQGRVQKHMPIRSVTFNGQEVKDFQISHNELIKGGKLVFNY